LELRDDLVLVGRLLIVRPVRHLLRGALLAPGSDRYSFRVWRYIKPLYGGTGGVGYADYIHAADWEVWQPHFRPMLMDVLAEDIFEPFGRVTTLDDFAEFLSGTDRFFSERVIALALAGEPERALAYIRERGQSDPSNSHRRLWANEQLEFLGRDIGEVCAEFHGKEAEAALALKLGDIWQPAPFPAELPTSGRATSPADPLFVTTPWIARPSSLVDEVPDRPGDVRFATRWLYRNGRRVLLALLTAEQAEERHRNRENLSGGLLVTLRRDTGWDREEPDKPWYPAGPSSFVNVYLQLDSSSHRVVAQFRGDLQDDNRLHLFSVEVKERAARWSEWLCYFDLKKDEKSIHDSRMSPKVYQKIQLTDADRDLATCPIPDFGEFDLLVRRAREVLQNAGYRELA
jgi:hypothetical protein